MLSKAAFNALLKTLEEPPPHVKFIFATTEVQKIPITILSRCQRFDFAGIAADRILEQLKSITAREGMQADDEALELVARRAGGSMRDAESLLDQLLAFGGDRLTADQVRQLLGMAGDDRVLALAEAVVARDAGKALAVFDETAQDGFADGRTRRSDAGLLARPDGGAVRRRAGPRPERAVALPARPGTAGEGADARRRAGRPRRAVRDAQPPARQQPRPDARGNGPRPPLPAQRPAAGGPAGADARPGAGAGRPRRHGPRRGRAAGRRKKKAH